MSSTIQQMYTHTDAARRRRQQQAPPTPAQDNGGLLKPGSAMFKWKLVLVASMLAYAVLAVFCFLETRKLVVANLYSIQGTTLYIPLTMCVPASIQFPAGEHWIMNTTTTNASPCRDLDLLVRPTGGSVLMSVYCVIMYIAVDLIVNFFPRKWRGPFNHSTVMGMGLFLIFILLQAGIATGALVEQVNMWAEQLLAFIPTIVTTSGESMAITEAKPYVSTQIMAAATAFAFILAAGIMMDCVLVFYSQAQKIPCMGTWCGCFEQQQQRGASGSSWRRYHHSTPGKRSDADHSTVKPCDTSFDSASSSGPSSSVSADSSRRGGEKQSLADLEAQTNSLDYGEKMETIFDESDDEDIEALPHQPKPTSDSPNDPRTSTSAVSTSVAATKALDNTQAMLAAVHDPPMMLP